MSMYILISLYFSYRNLFICFSFFFHTRYLYFFKPIKIHFIISALK